MEKLYTCEEVAEMFSVKVTTVRSWINKGKLKAYRVGRLYRIHPNDLEAFKESGSAL